MALAALLLSPGSARAQGAGVDRTAAARALFDEGLALLDAERWEDAADRFERALALRPSPQITYNLTTALIQLGHLVRASELLRQVARDTAGSAEVRGAAETRLGQLLPRLGSLTVLVESRPSGVELFLDEQPLDEVLVGVAFPVDPGPHVVSARRQGLELASRSIAVREGAEATVVLQLPRRHRTRGLARRWWFWTAIGVGIAVVGGAVTAGVLVARDREE